MIFCIIITVAILFTFNYYVLCVELFLLGTGLGGELAINSTIFVEYIPKSKFKIFPLLMIIWITGGLFSALTISVLYCVTLPVTVWRS
jgi:MFS family permease